MNPQVAIGVTLIAAGAAAWAFSDHIETFIAEFRKAASEATENGE